MASHTQHDVAPPSDPNTTRKSDMTHPAPESTQPTQAPAGSPMDIFSDPSKLLLPSNYSFSTEKVVLQIPVDKPKKEKFFRVHPSPEYRLRVQLVKIEEIREMYLVPSHLYGLLPNLAKPYMLYYYVTREGEIGLWPVRMPDPDGKSILWWDTGHAAAARAVDYWIRLESGNGRYDVYQAKSEGVMPDPHFPKKTVEELFRLGFRNYLIDSPSHTLVRKLQGEI